VVGGENVVPARVERVAEEHPAVRSAVAVGLPDEDLGQVVGLVVDVDGAGVAESEIVRWMRDRLERVAHPRRILLVDRPLRDDAGKVRRSAWRDAFAVDRRSP
jgi:bile acid-coenzyme A ligase